MEEDYSVEKPRISKLTGPNYRPWSVQVQRLLISQSLWKVVELGAIGPKSTSTAGATVSSTEVVDAERTVVKDAKASTIIMGLCGQGALQYILLLDTAKEQWEALKAQFSPLGLQQLGAKTQAFISYQPSEGHATIAEVANDLTILQVEIGLISSLEKPTDSLKISVFFRVIRAIDPRFEPLILQLEVSKSTTDFNAIVAHLTEAERRMGAKDPLKETAFSARTPKKGSMGATRRPTGRFRGNCYNCGKLGHKSTECRAPKKSTGPSTGPLVTPGGRRGLSPTPDIAMEASWMATTGPLESNPIASLVWVIDSGASR